MALEAFFAVHGRAEAAYLAPGSPALRARQSDLIPGARVATPAIAFSEPTPDTLLLVPAIVAATHPSGLSSKQSKAVGEVQEFVEWLQDSRPECTDGAPGRPDKFAALIALSRRYQKCSQYYLSQVGVNTSTVWRWANGESRPSKFVGEHIVADVKNQLTEALWQLIYENDLLTPLFDLKTSDAAALVAALSQKK